MGGLLALLAAAVAGLRVARSDEFNCPKHLPCSGHHCRADTQDGNCTATFHDQAVCVAVCDKGYYATNSWRLPDNGVKNGYECKRAAPRVWWDNEDKGDLGCTATCPAKPPSQHATDCPESARKPAEFGGHACEPRCSAGYIRKGDGTFSCSKDGSWMPSGEMQCEPISCPAEPPCDGAEPCAKKEYGQRCPGRCKAGYQPSDGSGGAVYTCAENKRWEGGSLACEKVPHFCNINALPGSGVVLRPGESCNGTVGSTCYAACDATHLYTRDSGDDLYRCEASGQPGQPGTWVAERGHNLQCVRMCPLTKDGGPMEGSRFVVPCDRKPGSTCTALCGAGYKGGKEGTYKCVLEGSSPRWVPENRSLECELIGCPSSELLAHGTRCPSIAQGLKCHPACLAGYDSGGGTAEYTCQPNHKWCMTGDDVQCTATPNWCNSTGPISGSANVVISKSGGCQGKSNETCAVECAAGTVHTQGNQYKVRCKDHKWLPEDPDDLLVCERTCKGVKPPAPHASFRSDCEPSPQNTCTAQCDKHYTKMSGDPKYRCSHGKWQDGSIVCDISCEPGFAPTETGCASCDAGRFSFDGTRCLLCKEPIKNGTRCNKCEKGLGPSFDQTLCEHCQKGLESRDGVCLPPHLETHKAVATAWLIACVVVTTCGCCSVLWFIWHHCHTLRSLRPISLPECDQEQSYSGVFLFLCGIADLVLSMKTCYSMFSCELQGSMVLALCFLMALVVNYSTTVFLAFHTLNHIRESRPANALTTPLWSRASISTASSTTRTALGFRRLLPLIVVGSIPRFQSLAMLRLRLFGVVVLNYPMEDCHMFFIRNSGLHHVFVVDVPIVVIGSALIHSTVDDGQSPCEVDWTIATLCCKCFLMVWSLVSAITQLLLTGNCGTSIRGGRNVNGVLEIETVASVLRTTATSLQTTGDHDDRISCWVDDARGMARQSDGSTSSSILAADGEGRGVATGGDDMQGSE